MVRLAVLVLAVLAAACAPAPARPAAIVAPDVTSVPGFAFEADTFAFPNQIRARNPGARDLYANYCFVLARGVRQFHQFARFDPAAPRVAHAEYERLVRAVVSRVPWRPGLPPADRVVIPGYANLRAFSASEETAVKAGLGAGGIAAVEARQRDVLARLDAIYCGATAKPGCGFSRKPTRLDPPRAGKKPGFSGALDLGSTAGQILLLEYADGKPMNAVGWGRASKADIALAGRLHAIEYSVLARPPYVAANNSALFVPRMLDALTAPDGPAVSLIVGHDTQLAALAGLLDLHWQVPGFAADDPSPGEAIGFERLRDASGREYGRIVLRAQGLDQIRTLAPLDAAGPATVVTLPVPGCADPCPLDRFIAIVRSRLDHSRP